jgi:hypothetical protein
MENSYPNATTFAPLPSEDLWKTTVENLWKVIHGLEKRVGEMEDAQEDFIYNAKNTIDDQIESELSDKIDSELDMKLKDLVVECVEEINWDSQIVQVLTSTNTLEELMINGDFGVMVEKLARQVAEDVVQNSVMPAISHPIVLAFDKTVGQWSKIG